MSNNDKDLSADWARLFEQTGNDWNEWLLSARSLAHAAEAIAVDSGASRASAAGGQLRISGIHAMLLGYAAECALKGILVKRGEAVASSGGSLIAKYKTHNLRALAKSAAIAFSDDDDSTLHWLSVHVEYMGRYPVPTKFPDWFDEPEIRVAVTVDSQGNVGSSTSEEEHPRRGKAIVERLLERLMKH